MVFIAASVSVITVVEKKGASSSTLSVQAYQIADSGVQVAMEKIKKNPKGKISDVGLFPNCTNPSNIAQSDNNVDPILNLGSYSLYFFSDTGGNNPVTDCNAIAGNAIQNIKSVGIYKGTVRAVQVALAADCPNSGISEIKDVTITYGAVYAKDNKCWLDRNLGATSTVNDSTGYGWLFQWGRSADKHQFTSPLSSTTSTLAGSDTTTGNEKFITTSSSPYDWRNDNNDNRWFVGTNDPCPKGFTVPSSTQWNNLFTAEGITGSSSAYSSTLKLTTAGGRSSDGTAVKNQGSSGAYWSSTADTGSTNGSYFKSFGSSISGILYSGFYPDRARRAAGLSVRCIKK
jgi:uncharacterized protein (TIGR02145 family)